MLKESRHSDFENGIAVHRKHTYIQYLFLYLGAGHGRILLENKPV